MADPPPLSEAALAKVDALYEMLEESRETHGPSDPLTLKLEAKLEAARLVAVGGAGPRAVLADFGRDDPLRAEGCIEVEAGWMVSVVDIDEARPDWATVRVNGVTGCVPDSLLAPVGDEEPEDPLELPGTRPPNSPARSHPFPRPPASPRLTLRCGCGQAG